VSIRPRLPSWLTARRTEASSIAGVATGAFGINVASSVLRFAFQVVYARWLGVVEYGRFVYALNLGQLLAPAAGLGAAQSMVAFVPEYEAQEDWGHVRGLVHRSRQVTVLVGAAFAAVATAILVAREGRGGVNMILVGGFVIVPVLGLVTLQQELLKAVRRVVASYTLSGVVQPTVALLGALAVLVARGRVTAATAMATFIIALLLVLVAQARLLHRVLPPAAFHVAPEYDLRRWRTTASTLLLSSGFVRVILQSDIVVVGALRGPRLAAFYAVASRISDNGLLVLESVNAIVAPTISRCYARGDLEGVQAAVDSGVRLAFWPSLAFLAILAAFARPILSIFGAQYEAARWTLILLGFGGLVNAATGPCGYLLVVTGDERTFAKTAGVAAVANVVLCLALVGPLGMNGAALASALVMAVWMIVLTVVAYRRLGVRSYPRLRRGL